jgi:tetratricopeptide (TPR) repeat protein/tRNA A-37 threonylcarbamoyl transferase component Bud32
VFGDNGGGVADVETGVADEEHDLEGEAMRRRIRARLFGETHPEVTIGRFCVLELIGRGGMGSVYAARDEQLERDVAIKVIRDDHLQAGIDERFRVLREARMQARLSHPNVVQIHEVGEYERGVFIVMELIRGPTLRQWLDGEARPLAEILARFVEAARGLAAAHGSGIVHRDFKPANALVGADGRVRLMDFGLARGGPAHADTEPRRVAAQEPTNGATATSRHAGTPAYMSPEQVLGAPCDARSDQYSFAVALMEAVLGRLPPSAHHRLIEDVPLRELVTLTRRGAPGWLRDALARGLALRPEDRFSSMNAFIAVLEERPRRRRRWWMGATVVLALSGAVAVGASVGEVAPPRCPDPRAQMADRWNEARRQGIAAAFAATGLVYAEESWARTARGLEEFAERWAAARRDNCEATWTRGEQSSRAFDRSAQCLDHSRQAWDTLLAVLDGASVAVVADAEGLVASLPAPEPCRTPTVLLGEEDVAVGADDVHVSSVVERARILVQTQQGRQAADLLLAELPRIRADERGGRDVEALLVLGEAEGRLLGDGVAAGRTLHEAHDRALAARRLDLVWKIWAELAHVQVGLLATPTDARISLAHARSARPKDSPIAEAALSALESELLLAEGRAVEAVAARRAALERLQSALPIDHPEILRARRELAAGLGEAQQFGESRELHRELLRELTAIYGADHPGPARVEINLGLDLLEMEDLAGARGHLEHARAVMVDTYGPAHLWLANIDLALAQIDAAEDHVGTAIGRAEAALAIHDASLPRGHVERVLALVLLSQLYVLDRRFAEQLVVTRELLAIHDAPPGSGVLDLPVLLVNMGECLCELGRCPEGLPYFSRLMALHPDEDEFRASPWRGLGLAHAASGEHDLAVQYFEKALQIYDDAPTELRALFAPLHASTARGLADSLVALRRAPRRVRELRARADEIEATP